MNAHPPVPGLFVTGTDTGVGKTRVACALAYRLHDDGIKVSVRKPVESGCEMGCHGLVPADAMSLQEAAGGGEPLSRVNAIRLRAPLSPERAARLEGVGLELAAVVSACQLHGDAAAVLVEGAGGFCSPIAEGALNADLATALGLPVLLVAADRLGVINHTLLTAEAIAARGLRLAGVVLSRVSAQADDMDNAGELARWLDCPILPLAYGGQAGPAAWAAESRALQPATTWLGPPVPAVLPRIPHCDARADDSRHPRPSNP